MADIDVATLAEDTTPSGGKLVGVDDANIGKLFSIDAFHRRPGGPTALKSFVPTYLSRAALVAALAVSGTGPALGAELALLTNGVQFVRWADNFPTQRMNYEVTDVDPTATDPTAIALGTTPAKWLTQRFGRRIRPEQFGATSAGLVDDTTAIRGFEKVLNTGGKVGKIAGVHRIQRPGSTANGRNINGIRITASNTTVIGGGEGCLLMDTVVGGASPGTWNEGSAFQVWHSVENVKLEGLRTIWTVQPTRSAGYGFYVLGYPTDDPAGVSVTYSALNPAGTGTVNVTETFKPSRNITIKDCYAEKTPQGGIFCTGVDRPVVLNFKAVNCQADQVHMNACHRPIVDGVTAISCGDDTVAFVTYYKRQVVANDAFAYGSGANGIPYNRGALDKWCNYGGMIDNVSADSATAAGNAVRIAMGWKIAVGKAVAKGRHCAVIVDATITNGGSVGWTHLRSKGITISEATMENGQNGIFVRTLNVTQATVDALNTAQGSTLTLADFMDMDVFCGAVTALNCTADVVYMDKVWGVRFGKIKREGGTAGFGIRATDVKRVDFGDSWQGAGSRFVINRGTAIPAANLQDAAQRDRITIGTAVIEGGSGAAFDFQSVSDITWTELQSIDASVHSFYFIRINEMRGKIVSVRPNRSGTANTRHLVAGAIYNSRLKLEAFNDDGTNTASVLELGAGGGGLKAADNTEIVYTHRANRNSASEAIVFQGGSDGPINFRVIGKFKNLGETTPIWRTYHRGHGVTADANARPFASAKRFLSEIASRDELDSAISADEFLTNYIANNYDGVNFRRYRSAGPDHPLVFDVVTADPNASPTTTGDPTSRALITGTWLAQRFGEEVWAEQLGARRDGATSDTGAIRNLLRLSEYLKFVARFGEGTYRINGADAPGDEAFSVDVGTWFEGGAIRGAGPRRTFFDFVPKDDYQAMLGISGGSGEVNNKFVEGFTAKTATGSAGKGILIRMADSCFVHSRLIALYNAAVGVEITNTALSGGQGFSEFNTFDDLYIAGMVHAGVQFHRRGGTNSLHGTDFRRCFITVNNGPGIRIGGNNWASAPAASTSFYLYNSWFDFRIMSDTAGTKKALIVDGGANIENLDGRITVENTGGATHDFECISGGFNFQGKLNGITPVSFSGAARDNMDFQGGVVVQKQSRAVKQAFTDSWLSEMSPGPAGNLMDHGKVNGGGALIAEMIGNNLASILLSVYDPSANGKNGVMVGHRQFADATIRSTRPGTFIRGDGSLIEMRAAGGTIRARGQTTGLDLGTNGRIGGAIGRVPAVTGIAANASPQTVTLFTNASGSSMSLFYVRLTTASFTDYDVRLFGIFFRGPGGAAGRVKMFEPEVLASAGGLVTEIPVLDVDTNGALRLVDFLTDRAIVVSGGEISLGNFQTS